MKCYYVGFRIEIANRFIGKNFTRRFNGNSTNNKTKILELNREGKIVIEKIDKMLIAHGQKSERGMESGLANFSLLIKMNSEEAAQRIIKIINVLGNDRLIRERVNVFTGGHSMLNALPELEPLKQAFIKLEKIAPGFTKAGWYYAPEAIFV